MTFDPCPHHITQLLIKVARARRKEKSMPEEANITILEDETRRWLGMPILRKSSQETNHLPAPWEMQDAQGKFTVPRNDCPGCGSKQTVILAPLCLSCRDAENGKYKSVWSCLQCGWKQKNRAAFSLILKELNVKIPEGDKQALGIMTMTDTGLQ